MKNNKAIIYLIFFSLTTFVIVGAAFYFLYVIKNKNEENRIKITMLQVNNVKKQNAQQLASKANEVTAALKKVNSFFIDPSTIDLFADYLENLGKITNTSVKVESVTATPSKTLLDVKMNAQGEFSNAVWLVTLLENAPYKIDILEVSFNKIEGLTMSDTKNASKPNSLWRVDIHFTILVSN